MARDDERIAVRIQHGPVNVHRHLILFDRFLRGHIEEDHQAVVGAADAEQPFVFRMEFQAIDQAVELSPGNSQ